MAWVAFDPYIGFNCQNSLVQFDAQQKMILQLFLIAIHQFSKSLYLIDYRKNSSLFTAPTIQHTAEDWELTIAKRKKG